MNADLRIIIKEVILHALTEPIMLRSFLILFLILPSLHAADIDVLLPESSQQVTYVNVKRLTTAPLVKTMLMSEIQERLKGTDVPKWLKEAGIDPRKDLETITMVMNPPKRKPRDSKKSDDSRKGEVEKGMGFVVIRGTFDGVKIMGTVEKAIAEAGDMFSISKEDGLKIVKFKPKVGDEFYLTMVDGKTIVGSTDTNLLHAAAKVVDDRNARPVLKNELAALIKSLDDKAAFYQAMLFDGSEVASTIGENPLFEDVELLKKQVSEMTSYSITARVGTDVTFEFATGLKSKEAASAFSETAKTMVEKGRTLLPLVAAGKVEFTGIVGDLKKTMKVTVDGDVVMLSARITGDSIGKAFEIEE